MKPRTMLMLAVTLAVLAAPLAVRAQQAKVYRVGLSIDLRRIRYL